MKKCTIIIFVFLLSKNMSGQVLLEDRDGDQVVGFKSDIKTNNLSLVKLNTGDQSLGFNYLITTYLHNPNDFSVHEFGVKVKPTEGYAAVFSTGQFSPGISMTYAYTKVNFLNSPLSWAGISIAYERNKYLLFDKSRSFQKQLYSENFNGFKVSANYNYLFKSIVILNITAGYSRKNNYDDLGSIDLQDISTVLDPSTSTERKIIKTKKAKTGSFESNNAYPMTISLTRATSTDAPGSANIDKLKIGYTGYFKNLASSGNLPSTDGGIIIFLTKQNKSGVRTPVLGLDIRINDIFSVQDRSEALFNKVEVGFTTNFSL